MRRSATSSTARTVRPQRSPAGTETPWNGAERLRSVAHHETVLLEDAAGKTAADHCAPQPQRQPISASSTRHGDGAAIAVATVREFKEAVNDAERLGRLDGHRRRLRGRAVRTEQRNLQRTVTL